jgi:hypothetical protein
MFVTGGTRSELSDPIRARVGWRRIRGAENLLQELGRKALRIIVIDEQAWITIDNHHGPHPLGIGSGQ